MSSCNSKRGTLEVICGPMFSGKSEELIRRLRRSKIAKQKVVVFKPAIDDRYEQKFVVSHIGNKIEALPIKDETVMVSVIKEQGIKVVGIDEAQFFSEKLIATTCSLVDTGVRVIIAGLDLDFRGVPFGPMPTLMAISDSITKLQAICATCYKDAHRTQRLVNGKPALFDDPIVLVGAQEAYQARCHDCFVIDKKQPLSCAVQ